MPAFPGEAVQREAGREGGEGETPTVPYDLKREREMKQSQREKLREG